MLEWKNLLNNTRRKDLYGSGESTGTAIGRTQIERDFDRILFATPTRRLADKTQVFPMEKNDSIRNRLTHSHEVSNLARSIGVRLAFDHAEEVFGIEHDSLEVKRNIPSMLAAVGLAHDLGNPPFGHQGEVAIQQWFQENIEKNTFGRQYLKKNKVALDFLEFDGNAQTFRLLTSLQVLNDKYGLNLTLGTLAALLKYPSVYGAPNKGGFKKYGVFKSEEEIVADVWKHTGLSSGIRHPLAYVMEACDDIAYSVIDAEDTIKKGYASFYDLMDFIESYEGNNDSVIKEVVAKSRDKNNEYKTASLSSRELNDISMQMFRVYAISEMVQAATEVFINNINKMMSGTIDPGFELIKNSTCALLCKATKEFDKRHGFRHRDVLKLELEGNNYIKSMMDLLWPAISKHHELEKFPFERFAFEEISENYRRVFNSSNKDMYAKCQLLCDAISGMTEKHLIRKHDELKALLDAK